MPGRLFGITVWAAIAMLLLGFVAPAMAQPANPGNMLYELIDQLQTGRNRPMLYGAEVQRIVTEQTNDTGVYPSLKRLGNVANVAINSQEQLRGGTLYHMTA